MDDTDQIEFSLSYLGLADSQDSTYATKAGFVVAVNSTGTGTMLVPPFLTPDLSSYLKTTVAAATYATVTNVGTIAQGLAQVMAVPAPTLDSVLGNNPVSAKNATVGTLTATTGTFSGVVSSQSIQMSRDGAVSDPYGVISITYPADTNSYSYYGMTRAGKSSYSFGIGANDKFFIGTGGSDGIPPDNTTSTHLVELDQAGNLTALVGVTSPSVTATKVIAGSIQITGAEYAFQDTDSFVNLVVGVGTQVGMVGTIPKRQVILGASGTVPPTTGSFRAGDIYIAG